MKIQPEKNDKSRISKPSALARIFKVKKDPKKVVKRETRGGGGSPREDIVTASPEHTVDEVQEEKAEKPVLNIQIPGLTISPVVSDKKVDLSKLTGVTISPVNKAEDKKKDDPGSFQGLDLSVTKVERPLRSGRSPRSSHSTSPRRPISSPIKSSPREAAISPRRASPREPAISPRRTSPREPAISPRRINSREPAISPRRSTAISPRRFNPKDPAISPRRSSPRACFSPKSAHNTSISSYDSRESLNQSTDSLNAFSFEADELKKDMAYEEAIESAIARGMRELDKPATNEKNDIDEKQNIHKVDKDRNTEASDKIIKLEEKTNIFSAPSRPISPPKSPPKISPPTSPRVNKYVCIRKSLKKKTPAPILKPLKPGLEITSQEVKTPKIEQEIDKLGNMNTNVKEINKKENVITNVKEINQQDNMNTNVQEINKHEYVTTNVNDIEKEENKEINKLENINTIVKEIDQQENVNTNLQEIKKQMNMKTKVKEMDVNPKLETIKPKSPMPIAENSKQTPLLSSPPHIKSFETIKPKVELETHTEKETSATASSEKSKLRATRKIIKTEKAVTKQDDVANVEVSLSCLSLLYPQHLQHHLV
jgi:hypothetical protein